MKNCRKRDPQCRAGGGRGSGGGRTNPKGARVTSQPHAAPASPCAGDAAPSTADTDPKPFPTANWASARAWGGHGGSRLSDWRRGLRWAPQSSGPRKTDLPGLGDPRVPSRASRGRSWSFPCKQTAAEPGAGRGAAALLPARALPLTRES